MTKHSRRMNRGIQTIPADIMKALTRWDWPGNIRELESFIERAVILTNGPILRAPLAELESPMVSAPSTDVTLESTERDTFWSRWLIASLLAAGALLALSAGAHPGPAFADGGLVPPQIVSLRMEAPETAYVTFRETNDRGPDGLTYTFEGVATGSLARARMWRLNSRGW